MSPDAIQFPQAEHPLYWICACVKRRRGVMTHIKSNHPDVKKCRACGCTPDAQEQMAITKWAAHGGTRK
jgi:hypothetical protein